MRAAAALLGCLLLLTLLPSAEAAPHVCTPRASLAPFGCAATEVPDCSEPGSRDDAGWWVAIIAAGAGAYRWCDQSTDGETRNETTQAGAGGEVIIAGGSDMNVVVQDRTDGGEHTRTCTLRGGRSLSLVQLTVGCGTPLG